MLNRYNRCTPRSLYHLCVHFLVVVGRSNNTPVYEAVQSLFDSTSSHQTHQWIMSIAFHIVRI